MKIRQAMLALVVLAVGVTLTSVAAAGPEAAKQRVAIDVAGGQSFVLYPLQAGALKRDSGPSTADPRSGRSFEREGQQVSIYNVSYTLSGKLGSLTIRERNEWVDVSQRNARGFDYRPGVAIGTWKVVSGTGAYAKVVGGGRTAHAGMGKQWFIRLEGYLTVR
ncbi:MAG: hypothetical protein OEV72_03895 [Thermoleophilia bacterium]|nr:hypothetical protein [Thermoleophilia bacterium]